MRFFPFLTRPRTIRAWIYYSLAGVLLLAALLLGAKAVQFGHQMYLQRASQTARDNLFAQQVLVPENGGVPQDPMAARFAGYAALQAQNKDFSAWVSIQDTALDYPVMHTPAMPEYYLYRDFERRNSLYGIPFLQADCDLQAQNSNLIVYGHDMLDGSMFRTLHSYRTQPFRDEHPLITLDTLTLRHQYEVLCAFETDIATDSFRYEDSATLTQEQRQQFLAQCAERAFYPAQPALLAQAAREDSPLLVLSTCSGTQKSMRFVVVAVRINLESE